MTMSVEGNRAAFVVEWREGFKVNIPQVDYEHRHLFMLVKALDLRSVERTLEELLDYVVTHFTNEQSLMEESGYPGFQEHLQLHESFSNFVADFLAGSDSWSEARIRELRRFLNKWLIGHILTHDMRFGNWHLRHHGPNAMSEQGATLARHGLLSKMLGIK